jgi:hypothetical protein
MCNTESDSFGSTRVIRKKDANGRRAISWIKDYGSYQWRYKGIPEYGQQVIRCLGGTNAFSWFLWNIPVLGVPDEAPALSPRTPQAKEN